MIAGSPLNYQLNMGVTLMLNLFKILKNRKYELILANIKSKMLYYEQLYNACLSSDINCDYYLASVCAYRDILSYLENNLK